MVEVLPLSSETRSEAISKQSSPPTPESPTLLKESLSQHEAPLLPGVPMVPWPWFSVQQPYVVLLPLSGAYGAAGQLILEALRRSPQFHPVEAVDTALFRPEELVNLLAVYEPAWILGPLRPEVAHGLIMHGADWPMLLLASHCPNQASRCVPLVPSLQQVFLEHAPKMMRDRGLLLADKRRWQRLPPNQRARLSETGAPILLIDQHHMDRALRRVLNVTASYARIHQLRQQLSRSLVAYPRARQDFIHILVYGSADQAYQAATLIRYWALEADVVWFPAQLSSAVLRRQPVTWPAMTVWVYPFLLIKDHDDDGFGIFHAIAETVAKLLTIRPGERVMTPLGWIETDQLGWRIGLMPVQLEAGTDEVPG